MSLKLISEYNQTYRKHLVIIVLDLLCVNRDGNRIPTGNGKYH